ncbi:MAG: hypothetical protein KIT69_07030 [Propionibacteriaceae bacterium]|nr:hypothetical protein [Propionibacteriaceae bacterium]
MTLIIPVELLYKILKKLSIELLQILYCNKNELIMAIILDILYTKQKLNFIILHIEQLESDLGYFIQKNILNNKDKCLKYIQNIYYKDASYFNEKPYYFYEYLKKCKKLKKLDLSDMDYSMNFQNEISVCMLYLSQSFYYLKNLKILDLSFININNDTLKILIINMKFLQKLKSLNLRENNINDDDLLFICYKNFKYLKHLKNLYLSENQITEKGIEIIFKNLSNTNLITIDLDSNYIISDDGYIDCNDVIYKIETYIIKYNIVNKSKLKQCILGEYSSMIRKKVFNISKNILCKIYKQYNIKLYY